MTYVVCQNGDCTQTYPIKDFDKTATNVSCKKCGGVLVDGEGRANLSRNPDVRKFMSAEDLVKNEEKSRKEREEELKRLRERTRVLEAEKEEEER